MNNKIKLALLSVFLCAAALFANNYTIYAVDDQAGILTAEEKQKLNEKIRQIQIDHNYDLGIYIAVVDSFETYNCYDIEDFSEYWYKENNLGTGPDKNGLLFILSMNDRDYDICAYGGFAHTTYTDYGKQKLAEAAVAYLKNNDWYKGFDAFVSKAEKFLTMSENGKPFDYGTVRFDLEIFCIAFFSALIGSFIIAFIVTMSLRGKMNNVKAANYASNYIVSNNVAFSMRENLFTHITEHRTPINQNNNGSSGGSHGGTSVNSGGFSHSSGKF